MKKYVKSTGYLFGVLLTIFVVACGGGSTTGGGTTTTNVNPEALFTLSSNSVNTIDVVSFDASTTTDSDGTIATYAWDFGDGSSANGVTSTHTYTSAGSFNIVLTVTDNDGATDTATSSITVVVFVAPDTTAPAVTTLNPTDSSQNIAVDASIQITFSEDINASSFNATSARLSNAAGTVTATYSINGDIGTITPDTQLENLTEYTVSLLSTITDLAGNNLPASTSTFATIVDTTAWYRLTNASRGAEVGMALFNKSSLPLCRMKFGGDLWRFTEIPSTNFYALINIDQGNTKSIEAAAVNDGNPCQLNGVDLAGPIASGQSWILTHVGDSFFRLHTFNGGSSFALDDGYHRTISTSDTQRWKLIPAQAGDIRLVDGANDETYEGRIEVFFNNVSGTVCDDIFGTADATVACRQLGMNTANATGLILGDVVDGADTQEIFLDELGCVGTEGRLADCPNSGIGIHDCGHFEDQGVSCIAPTNNLRLVGGTTEKEGRLEISIDNQWQTVCDDFFDNNALGATVACRQLGFTAGTVATQLTFPAGTGIIGLDDVQCAGDETSLIDCPSLAPGVNNCSHNEDVGLFCQQDYDSWSLKPGRPFHLSLGSLGRTLPIMPCRFVSDQPARAASVLMGRTLATH